MAEQTNIEQMLQTNPRYATMDASTLLMERRRPQAANTHKEMVRRKEAP